MDKAEICENCKHYKQHYCWCGNGLQKTYSGHCMANQRMKLVHYIDYCDKWELCDIKDTPPNETIEAILNRAAKQITNIAAILKIRSR